MAQALPERHNLNMCFHKCWVHHVQDTKRKKLVFGQLEGISEALFDLQDMWDAHVHSVSQPRWTHATPSQSLNKFTLSSVPCAGKCTPNIIEWYAWGWNTLVERGYVLACLKWHHELCFKKNNNSLASDSDSSHESSRGTCGQVRISILTACWETATLQQRKALESSTTDQ